MASSAKNIQSSPAPISQPVTPPTPEDPLVVQAILHIEQMDESQMARAAGQILYDLAIQDPTITVASPEILGQTLKVTMLNDQGKFFKSWYPLLRLYLKHSLVAKDPRLVAIAITRMITVQLYATGKLTDANSANQASA